MLEYYKKLGQEASIVRYMVLVLLGAGINFTVGFGLMLSSLSVLLFSTSQALPSSIPASVSILATSYFVIGIIYSTSVSLVFQPKRIISPLYIQITTSAFVPIIVVWLLLRNPALDLITFSFNVFFYFAVSLAIFVVAGVGQIPIVRYLVGLNGTKENTHSFGLMIDGKIEDVLKVLRTDDLQEALSVEEMGTRRNSYLFTTSWSARNRVFISVIADPQDAKKTQLAVLSYTQTYYGISKPNEIIENQNKSAIIKALKMAGMRPLSDNTDSLARQIVYRYGLTVTESKLLGLRSLPPHSKAIGIGVALMSIVMTVLWKYDYVSPEMFETFWIFAGFAILFDFLPLLSTKHKRRSD